MDAKEIGRTDQACRFCGIPNRVYTDTFDLPVAESENLFAVASIGGFIPGWTLVCPKRHCLNLSDLYASVELVEFSRSVADAIFRAFGRPVVVFEHGCGRQGSLTGCGTDHAHLHLVPFRGSLVAAVRDFDPASDWMRGRAQDVRRILRPREYLIMADTLDGLFSSALMCSVEVPRSQYFRLALANALGLEASGDYRLHPFTDLARETALRVAASFEAQLNLIEEVA